MKKHLLALAAAASIFACGPAIAQQSGSSRTTTTHTNSVRSTQFNPVSTVSPVVSPSTNSRFNPNFANGSANGNQFNPSAGNGNSALNGSSIGTAGNANSTPVGNGNRAPVSNSGSVRGNFVQGLTSGSGGSGGGILR